MKPLIKLKVKKTSAALVSLIIHAVIILMAGSFAVVSVIVKDDKKFEAKTITRPRMPLKKLTVPVDVRKRNEKKPKLRKTIVVKKQLKSIDLKMPEVTGVLGGTGYLDEGGGLTSLGFGFDIDLFGDSTGSGNELVGTFFDLKLTPDGSPTDMAHTSNDMKAEDRQNNEYTEVLRNFARSWNISTFEKEYFKAPSKKFAITFMIPYMSANEAPKG